MKTLVLKMVNDMHGCPKGALSTFQLLQDFRMEWRPSGNTTLFRLYHRKNGVTYLCQTFLK